MKEIRDLNIKPGAASLGVSVITPAYNAEKFLAESLDSILAQTFQDFEILVMNNASTDRTGEIADEYATRDPRIRVVHHPEKRNNSSRNAAMNLARGKYVAWNDADDISTPDRLQLQFDFMEANPEVGLCGGFVETFDANGPLDFRKYPEDDATIRKYIFKYSTLSQGSAMGRLDAYRDVGGYDVDFDGACDYEMTFRIGSKYRLANVPHLVLLYRQHDGAVTNTRMRKMLRQTIRIRKHFARTEAYSMSLIDRMALIAVRGAMFLPVAKVKSWFEALRRFLAPKQ